MPSGHLENGTFEIGLKGVATGGEGLHLGVVSANGKPDRRKLGPTGKVRESVIKEVVSLDDIGISLRHKSHESSKNLFFLHLPSVEYLFPSAVV